MDRNTLTAIVLSLAVIFAYQTFFAPQPPQKATPVAEPQTLQRPPAADAVAVPIKPGDSYVARAQSQQRVAESDINVDTPLYTAVFTTRGGALKSFKLKSYNKTLDKNSGLIELVAVKDFMPKPLNVSFPDSTFDIPPDSMYEADQAELKLSPDGGQKKLTFRQIYPNEIKVEKIYTFQPGKYVFDLEIRVHNLSSQTLNQNPSLSWTQFVDPAVETDSYSHDGPISYIANTLDRHVVKKITEQNVLGPNVAWGAFESKYFMAAMVPHNPILTSLYLSNDSQNMVSVGLRGPKNVIPVGQVALFNYSLYMGPKDYEILKEKGVGLEYAIDFSDWLRWLVVPLLIVLKFLFGYVQNYGLAIIILTILIKIIFWPLGNKSYRSMKEMQKLQPKVAELRERYKDDKTRLSQETMALYKSHKVNPLGGCLPMIIQIPVFFGLYKALLYAIELRHSPLFLWIQDLSAKDPYYITPVIMGVTMFIQQKMAPPVGDPMQAKIMLLMPVVFTVLFLGFPSGLVLYWLFNNVISIGQQMYINKKHS